MSFLQKVRWTVAFAPLVMVAIGFVFGIIASTGIVGPVVIAAGWAALFMWATGRKRKDEPVVDKRPWWQFGRRRTQLTPMGDIPSSDPQRETSHATMEKSPLHQHAGDRPPGGS